MNPYRKTKHVIDGELVHTISFEPGVPFAVGDIADIRCVDGRSMPMVVALVKGATAVCVLDRRRLPS